MAKIYGLFGSMTGKVADVVMAVRNGEQIARKYQPVVYNPATDAQIQVRAKLKLMSQLSAVMSPVIAIPREGTVSSRNLFVKKNYQLSSYSQEKATIDLNSVTLTGGVIALPALQATISNNGDMQVLLSSSVEDGALDRVIYAVFAKEANGGLRYVKSLVATTPGATNRWSMTSSDITNETVILGYGIRDNTESAKVIFGNLTAPTAEQIAKLVVNRTLTMNDISLTETRGITVTPQANA